MEVSWVRTFIEASSLFAMDRFTETLVSQHIITLLYVFGPLGITVREEFFQAGMGSTREYTRLLELVVIAISS